jgi:hypothetical protein
MLTQRISLTNQDARKISSTRLHGLGTIAETADGRVYRYSQVGGVTLAPGKLNVAATVNADATNKTVAATVAAGQYSVVFDAGGTIVADAYKSGFLTVNDATGEGISYAVDGNSGVTGAGEVTVTLKEPLIVGLTVDVSEVTLSQNPWGGVVVSVADQLDMAVGISNVSATNAYFNWTQTRGITAALADESYAIGQALTIGSSVVGALEAQDAAGEQVVGCAIVAGVDTEYREVYLSVD